MPTDLRTPVGAHICRTVAATDPVPPVDPAFWRGLAIGLLGAVPFLALIGGIVWGLHVAGVVMP